VRVDEDPAIADGGAFELSPDGERMVLNWGPAHPATHGTLRVILELEGERIVGCDTEIGYLHRGFEKLAEGWTYTQCLNLSDRLNYCSSFINNVGWHLACEKLFGIEAPPRASYLRVILSEISRIADHMVCLGPNCVDIGALTPFWYTWDIREQAYDLLEMVTGARITTSFTRIGGLVDDIPDGFVERVRAFLPAVYETMSELEALLAANRIFNDRARGVGALSAEDALSYGWTGPCLRACGVPHDLRVAEPYLVYGDLEFDVPIGEHGDTYDRFFVRVEEARQSARLIEQALAKLPDGPVCASDKRIVLPPKQAVYGEMEGLIHHFEIVIHGPQAPPGAIQFQAVEGANGELGFTIISNGTGVPYRMHVRAPCFHVFAALPKLMVGSLLADLPATVASLNIIAGELDR